MAEAKGGRSDAVWLSWHYKATGAHRSGLTCRGMTLNVSENFLLCFKILR